MKTTAKKIESNAPQPPEPTPEEKAAAEEEQIKQRFAFKHFQEQRAKSAARQAARRAALKG